MQGSKRRPYQVVPKTLGCKGRTLYGVYQRALALTVAMDAERQIILSIAFAHVFEMELPKFTFAVRKYRAKVADRRTT